MVSKQTIHAIGNSLLEDNARLNSIAESSRIEQLIMEIQDIDSNSHRLRVKNGIICGLACGAVTTGYVIVASGLFSLIGYVTGGPEGAKNGVIMGSLLSLIPIVAPILAYALYGFEHYKSVINKKKELLDKYSIKH